MTEPLQEAEAAKRAAQAAGVPRGEKQTSPVADPPQETSRPWNIKMVGDVVAFLAAPVTDPATAIACHRAVGEAREPQAPQQGDTAGADRVEDEGQRSDGPLVIDGNLSRGAGQGGCEKGVSRQVERARHRAELRRQRSLHAAGLCAAFGEDDDVAQCGTFVPPARRSGELEGQLHLFKTLAGEVFIGGTHRCRKPAVCPWCGATITAHLAQVLGTGVARWKFRDATVVMATVTLAHARPDRLVELLDVLDECLRRLLTKGRSKEATAVMTRWRLATWAGLLEVMDGPRNGWGPHYHLALFLDRGELDQEEVDALEHELASLVVRWQLDLWHRVPSVDRVLTLVQFRDGRGLAEYLTKAGLEVAGGQGKEGRTGDTRSFHAMCVDLAETVAGRTKDQVRASPDRAAVDRTLARVHEYRDAMHGREYFRHAGNFWDLLVPEVAERSSRAIVSAGRTLEHTDRAMLAEAAARLRVAVGEDAEDDVDVVGVDDEAAGAEMVASIASDVWAQVMRALRYRRIPPGLHLLELVQGIRHGPHAAVCELVEKVGAEQALRMLAVLLPRPPLVWRTADNVVVLTNRVPVGAQWDLIEDWSMEAVA